MNRLNSLIVVIAVIAVAMMTACGGGGKGSSTSNNTGGTTIVGSPLSITTTTVPDGVAGKPYSVQLTATGGIAPYRWTTFGGLPAGLTMNSSGVVSGAFSFGTTAAVQVQDSGVPAQFASANIHFGVYPELSIYTASVPDGHINVPYDFVIQSFSVKTWSVSAGQLPPGLQLASPSSTQVEIKGTTTQIGTYTFTVQAESVSNPPQVAAKSFTLVIDDNPAVLTAQLLDVVRGKPYSDTLQAVNGVLPYHWSLQSGTLPIGMSLDANTGVLSGTTQGYSAGYNFTFQVSDSSTPAKSGSRVVPINVVDQLFMGYLDTTATINQPYFSYVSGYGGRQPFNYSILSGSLPPGITMIDGRVSGTPTQLGNYSFVLRLVDSTNPPQTTDQAFSINVKPPALTMSSSLPTRIPVGFPFNGFVAAQGGTPPYSWTLTSGTLPDGLQLDSSTGELTGTPVTKGVYNFTVQVKDSGSQTTGAAYQMTVADPLGRNDSIQRATLIENTPVYASISPYSDPVDIANPDVDYYKFMVNNGTVTDLRVQVSYAFDSVLELVDANGVRLNSCSGPNQPSGPYTSPCLNDDVQDGVIKDSELHFMPPGAAGTQSTIYAKVMDWRGDARPDMTYYLYANNLVRRLQIGTDVPKAFTKGAAVTQQLSATGGTGTPTWMVAAGTLPPGLTLTSAGLLSGTTSANGMYTFTVTANDQGNPVQSATQTFTISVADPVQIVSPTTMPDACLNQPYSFTPQTSGGSPPFGWSFFSDSWLPAMNFDNPTGTISGTPQFSGTFTARLGVGDAAHSVAWQSVTLTVKASCP